MRVSLLVFMAALGSCLLAAGLARADEAGTCAAHDGTFLTGTVVSGPRFAPGHERGNVELSHTHVKITADQDGNAYDVAIDNVFAAGYDAAGEAVPAPLDSISVGTKLELCGQLYTSGGYGIHFVHTDCGQTPSPRTPDGWLKIIDPASGLTGPNLEDSQEYCSLFAR